MLFPRSLRMRPPRPRTRRASNHLPLPVRSVPTLSPSPGPPATRDPVYVLCSHLPQYNNISRIYHLYRGNHFSLPQKPRYIAKTTFILATTDYRRVWAAFPMGVAASPMAIMAFRTRTARRPDCLLPTPPPRGTRSWAWTASE